MADPIRFLRLTALPTVFLTDALYFIQTGPDTFDLYVTGNDAVPHQMGRGPAGEPGPSWSTISGGGTISGGNPGDFCLHTDTGDLEQNVDGTWTVIGNLKGPPGPAAPQYTHTQTAPASTWIITHNLGRVAAVSLFGLDGSAFFSDVVSSFNAVTVTFPSPVSGIAVLT